MFIRFAVFQDSLSEFQRVLRERREESRVIKLFVIHEKLW
jgi:hypothetical protein